MAYGGTDSHMVLMDCKGITGPDGTPLMGDPAANLLDIAGIVANRNTIPGDSTAAYPSGVRFGTPWVTQRGLDEEEMTQVAGAIARLMRATCSRTWWKRRPRTIIARGSISMSWRRSSWRSPHWRIAAGVPEPVESGDRLSPLLLSSTDEPQGDARMSG